jgi:succinate dehydrogenase flavin-adding protein (antitoxin of CptAB toxin-antitoxin module)
MSDSVKKFYEQTNRLTKKFQEGNVLHVGLDGVKKDPIVEKVKREFDVRSKIGISKYGKTLEENDLSLLQWLQHAKEEAMDQVLYLQCVIDEIRSEEDNTTKKI